MPRQVPADTLLCMCLAKRSHVAFPMSLILHERLISSGSPGTSRHYESQPPDRESVFFHLQNNVFSKERGQSASTCPRHGVDRIKTEFDRS